MNKMKCAIIGGGASGLACAIEAKKEAEKKGMALDVIVYEKNDRVGKKILATGNGRCNMTNMFCSKNDYFGSPSFAEYALDTFSPQSNIEFFESLGLFSKADSEGRVYPLSNQASGVLDALRLACEKYSVVFECGKEVTSVTKKGNAYIINGSERYDKVVFSCGGKAAVKNFNGYELLKPFKIKSTETYPSLVKLTTSVKETKQLKGIKAAVRLTLLIDGKPVAQETGELLFGDFVLSGIAAMQLSPYISRHFAVSKTKPIVSVDFVPGFDYTELVEKLRSVQKNCAEILSENLLLGFMPKKIGAVIVKNTGIDKSVPVGRLTDKNIKTIASLAKRYVFEICGTKGFSDCQVTAGGIETSRFNKETLESKVYKGLYCCGEFLDVDGLCGGYNLQWAWSSGRLCGRSLVNG